MNKSKQFFYEFAGFGYNSETETREKGKIRNANALAAAEQKALSDNLSFSWAHDPDTDSSEFSDEEPAWQLWVCYMHAENGEIIEALGGIDFGRDGKPWGNPYHRVVEAELALDHYAK